MKKPMDRRTFIKGTGVAIALPFLEAMLPINRSWAAAPQKFAVFFTGVGMTANSSGTAMHPDILKILAPYNSYATYITGLINDGITNNHDELPGFMSGTKGDAYKNATSVDRVAAGLLNQGTIFPDGLFVGSQSRAGQQSAIRRVMSHKLGSQSTLYHDPRTLFDLITKLGGFKGTATPTVPTPAGGTLKKDVLSLSLDSIKALKRELSSADNAVLDKHLTAIEQIEASLGDSTAPAPSPAGTCAAPSSVAASYPSDRGDLRMPILAEIAAVALNCDLTRTLAFLVFPDGSGSNPDHMHLYDHFAATLGKGRPGIGYHEWTHNRWSSASDTSKSNQERCDSAIRQADIWDTTVFSKFMEKLNASTLNDSAIAYASGGAYEGSHPSSGEEGYHANIPFALFGKLGGKITPRGATPINLNQSVCNVWLTLLKHMGYTGNSFGTIREPTRMASL